MNQQVKNFLENEPLLTKKSFDRPLVNSDLKIEHIDFFCEKCSKSRVFKNAKMKNAGGGAGGRTGGAFVSNNTPEIRSGITHFYFECTVCQNMVEFWLEYKKGDKNWIRKLGQYPPWDISINKELEKFLGDDAIFLKKGKICLSQSFGLAAAAYFRRVLENEIEPLLNLLIEKKAKKGADEEEVESYRQICKGKDFSAKTNLVLKIAPESLIVDGINPFKILHDFLSKGIHSLSENECRKIAQKTIAALEFIVIELNREKKHQQKFVQNLKDLDRQRN